MVHDVQQRLSLSSHPRPIRARPVSWRNMPSTLATVSGCALILLARPAETLQVLPSSFQSRLPGVTSSRIFESSPSTATTTFRRVPTTRSRRARATALSPQQQQQQQQFLQPQRRRHNGDRFSMLSDSGDSTGDCGSGSGWLPAEWRRGLVTAAVGLSFLSGGLLTTMSPPGSQGSAAQAAMAPSLMQDEKGYISIFEKVGVAVNCIVLEAAVLC